MAGLMCLSDETGQPVLHLPAEDVHTFFVLSAGVLYVLEIRLAVGDSIPTHDNNIIDQSESMAEQ